MSEAGKKKRNSEFDEDAVKHLFNKMDVNGDGLLSYDEIKSVFKTLYCDEQGGYSDELVHGFIEKADENKDGEIDYEEMLSVAKKVHEGLEETVLKKFWYDVQHSKSFMFDKKLLKKLKGLPDGVLCNLAKVGGTVVMLRDNKGLIYKEMNDTAELEFYQLVADAAIGGSKPDPFLRYLPSNRLIPSCDLQGYVVRLTIKEEEEYQLPVNPSGYFKQVSKDYKASGGLKITPVIIMENLIEGMKTPASCDFKLGNLPCGSFPGEPGYHESQSMKEEVLSWGSEAHNKKAEVLKKWKKFKTAGELDTVTSETIGLQTKIPLKGLKVLMKTWRQEQNSQLSPVKELCFRCCGMKVKSDKGCNFKYEPQKTDGYIDISKPMGMSTATISEIIEDFCQNDKDLAQYFIQRLNELALWFSYNTHYRFYASSVCLFYDMEDHSKRECKWLDFAHALPVMNEDGSKAWKSKKKGGQIDQSVKQALHNLVDCIAPTVWDEE